jgi:hypothetical protein
MPCPLLEDTVARGDASAQGMTYLMDRVLMDRVLMDRVLMDRLGDE